MSQGRHRHDADSGRDGRVELTKFGNPELVAAQPAIAPPNTLGLRQIMFAVALDNTSACLHAHGAERIATLMPAGPRYVAEPYLSSYWIISPAAKGPGPRPLQV